MWSSQRSARSGSWNIATVTAAAQAGAQYLDCSGEESFVRRVFELDPVAAARGSTVVPAFGYASDPGNLAGARPDQGSERRPGSRSATSSPVRATVTNCATGAP